MTRKRLEFYLILLHDLPRRDSGFIQIEPVENTGPYLKGRFAGAGEKHPNGSELRSTAALNLS